jgi:hypothetical protein
MANVKGPFMQAMQKLICETSMNDKQTATCWLHDAFVELSQGVQQKIHDYSKHS